MTKNKLVLYLTVLVLVLVICIPTIYKVVTNHRQKLYIITEKRILEAAFKCINEDVCNADNLTLKDLYDNNYLDKQIDPNTKRYYSEKAKIIKKEEGLVFNPE